MASDVPYLMNTQHLDWIRVEISIWKPDQEWLEIMNIRNPLSGWMLSYTLKDGMECKEINQPLILHEAVKLKLLGEQEVIRQIKEQWRKEHPLLCVGCDGPAARCVMFLADTLCHHLCSRCHERWMMEDGLSYNTTSFSRWVSDRREKLGKLPLVT